MRDMYIKCPLCGRETMDVHCSGCGKVLCPGAFVKIDEYNSRRIKEHDQWVKDKKFKAWVCDGVVYIPYDKDLTFVWEKTIIKESVEAGRKTMGVGSDEQ